MQAHPNPLDRGRSSTFSIGYTRRLPALLNPLANMTSRPQAWNWHGLKASDATGCRWRELTMDDGSSQDCILTQGGLEAPNGPFPAHSASSLLVI